ncbi:unnamed protein product [marine sediment metagenome]|uniref:Cdc6 C-terminal domain-containing protein n=1 Tax=marine sediment metagenome TaxID=412755 RepID=X1A1Y3_9ZZZZ
MEKDYFRKKISKKSVFKDFGTLNLSYLPVKLYCRDVIIKDLIQNFRGIIEKKGVFSGNCLLIGEGGVGKTLSAKFFAKNFREIALEKNINLIVEYFDCINFRTKSKIIRTLLAKYCQISGRGFSDEEVMIKIITKLKNNEDYIFLILDEVNLIPKDDIWALLDISEAFGHYNVRLSLLLISGKHDWIKIDSVRLLSRLNRKIELTPYNFEEAKKILKYRSNIAFTDGVILENNLELIAKIVDDTKNMRHGIEILQLCGQFADKEDLIKINAEMIRKAATEVAYPSFRSNIIDKLKPQELLSLYAVVRVLVSTDNSFTIINKAYEEYKALCKFYEIEPHVKMSFRKYIRQLNTLKVLKADSIRIDNESRGRHLKITLLDVSAKKLGGYLGKILEKKFFKSTSKLPKTIQNSTHIKNIKKGESEIMEFKSSFKWDLLQEKKK